MAINDEALLNALKMMGVTDPETAKNVRLVETLASLSRSPTPEAMMALLSQINPKVAPYITMLRSMNQLQQETKEETKQTETTTDAHEEPFVQYNHPDL